MDAYCPQLVRRAIGRWRALAQTSEQLPSGGVRHFLAAQRAMVPDGLQEEKRGGWRFRFIA
eukprot:scaffold133171_cov29-Tisochrysis_lutea.AAC.3